MTVIGRKQTFAQAAWLIDIGNGPTVGSVT